jgi:Zn finger protein HypA/HybF involved in hydrogenase expression
MFAMNNIKVSCKCCRNDRFFKMYQPIEKLECPDCSSKVHIYILDYGFMIV